MPRRRSVISARAVRRASRFPKSVFGMFGFAFRNCACLSESDITWLVLKAWGGHVEVGMKSGETYFGELWIWLAEGGNGVFVCVIGHCVRGFVFCESGEGIEKCENGEV